MDNTIAFPNESERFEDHIQDLWNIVVQYCNSVLDHADSYGFQLMEMQDPNVHKVLSMLNTMIIPFLTQLYNDYDCSPESGMKIANIKQYSLHLKEISLAVEKDDFSAFEAGLAKLKNEPML